MNKTVTSEEDILKVSRKIISEKGLSFLSMRAVAAECGISVGSVYNYFPSKTELIRLTVESVWKEIFRPLEEINQVGNFACFVQNIFGAISEGSEKYRSFFSMHSLSFASFASEDKAESRQLMERYFKFLKDKMLSALEADENVRENIFTDGFSAKEFTDHVFTLLIALLLEGRRDCISLIKMIENCIY